VVPGAKAIWALAYLIVLGSLVAYSAFGWLLKNTRPALATSYAYVNPVVALALGVGLGGEHPAPTDYAGLGLVLAAVALVGWAQRGHSADVETAEDTAPTASAALSACGAGSSRPRP
jgi:drug/metabolite transporter (DMT)-like permease